MLGSGLRAGLAKGGPATHATVAGGYAWATTVAPFAWWRESGVTSKVAAAFALVALVAGWLGDRRRDPRIRIVTLWTFVLFCALAWSSAPGALAPLRLDAFRGLTGTLAWGLFAFAWAAPALDAPDPTRAVADDEPLLPRRTLVGREGYLLLGAGALAVALQAIGWEVPGVERSLLVRFVGIAAGLVVLDAAVDVALARYTRRARATALMRLRTARPWLIALGALALVGVLLAINAIKG
jgi:hypothetical protein